MHIYPLQIDPTPPTIEHRYLGNHYIKYISYIEQCIYTDGRLTAPLSELSIDAFHTATPNLADIADIAQCIYTYDRLTHHPQSIEHRCLDYCSTKLGRPGRYCTMHIYTKGRLTPIQLSIVALNITTPNLADLADIAQCTYTHGKLTPPPPPIEHRFLENHYTKYVLYIPQCIHIYGRLNPHPWSIEHRCLDYCYTKIGRSGRYCTMHIYTKGRLTPSQLSIVALNITAPNLADLADIAQCTYTHGRLTSQSIKHRCLEYHYTKASRSSRYSTMHIYPLQIDPTPLLQLSIDLWKTITPNMFHIYPWQIDPTPSPPTKHRSLENHYTKYISYIA